MVWRSTAQPQVTQTTDSLLSFAIIDTDTSGLANCAPATALEKNENNSHGRGNNLLL